MSETAKRVLTGFLLLGVLLIAYNWLVIFCILLAIIGLIAFYELTTMLFKKTGDFLTSILVALFLFCFLVFPLFSAYYLRVYLPDMFLLALLATAIADIGAYFGGKVGSWEKTKLAPSISPKKTWQGALAGIFLAIVFSVVFGFYFVDFPKMSIGLFMLLGLFIAIIGIAGDLIESKFKRFMDVKDSSNILPGHGGILDRFDSHFATIPFVALTLYLLPYISLYIHR